MQIPALTNGLFEFFRNRVHAAFGSLVANQHFLELGQHDLRSPTWIANELWWQSAELKCFDGGLIVLVACDTWIGRYRFGGREIARLFKESKGRVRLAPEANPGERGINVLFLHDAIVLVAHARDMVGGAF